MRPSFLLGKHLGFVGLLAALGCGTDTAPPAQGDGDGTRDGSPADGAHDGSPADGTSDGSPADGTHDGSPADGAHDGSPADGAHDGSPADGASDGSPADGASDGSPADGDSAPVDGDPAPSDGSADGHDGAEDAGVVMPVEPVRFIVFGDGGTGEDGQKKVAGVVKSVCAARGCSFALYLGDNIYDNGVTGPEDAQFQDKFELPYGDLDFPFYLALGNHDYGSSGSNIFPEDARSDAQVEYTAYSEKWNLPNYYYAFREGPIEFFVIDSNAIVLDDYRPSDEQRAWLDQAMAASDARWKIVLGHHGYVSNGDHGNAGSYDGLGSVPFFERFNGKHFKDFVESSICGKAQIYFAGHDHHREWLEPACGTNFIISGAAAKLRDVVARADGAATRWNDATKLGFLWVEIAGDTMTGVFYDENGAIDYEDVIVR